MGLEDYERGVEEEYGFQIAEVDLDVNIARQVSNGASVFPWR